MADLLGFTDSPSPMEAPQVAPADVQHDDPFAGMPASNHQVEQGPFAGQNLPEVNALREWEIKHEQALEEQARQEAKDKEARRKEAEAQLEKFYAGRREASEQQKIANRANAEDGATKQELAARNPWEKVAELIDHNQRPPTDACRDTSRMRTLLLQLKSSPVLTAS
eukprot:TRINITY_DN18951_c0_g2_i1.p2 TRINITY_DN18951_c0_g2~~TRINITY_DN18951_c0_g2_i1.p2  ORF type:complete len:190 (+),score=39.15 TRINITY_DN18951_c0_g2_i1:70-570(+)